MKRNVALLIAVLLTSGLFQKSFSQSKKRSFYELKVYHLKDKTQESVVDHYLKNAFLPALQRKGIKSVGVFKPVGNDTVQERRIYVLIPFKSANEFANLSESLDKDQLYAASGKSYLEAAHDNAPYQRTESILIKAFANMPTLQVPKLQNELQKRVYELRSYEGPTEKIYDKKVHMFNQGGEIDLFTRMGFNAVFFGSVLAGSKKPNLMYMTTFEDMPSRDAHWKTFVDDAGWKKLSGMEYYNHTVSHADIILLHPTDYSGI
jgi:hypothetical protein